MSQPKQRAAGYAVDMTPGPHRFAFVEGVGECRETFRQLIDAMPDDKFDIIVAAKAEYLFFENSPMWMEKFIQATQRYGILIADATAHRIFDMRLQEDEVAFRALAKHE
jgi:hypothetical protein